MRRREFLTKAAAAGVVAWATPVILSRPAYGVEGGEGTPSCRPTVKVCCTRYFCDQGNKYFPGIAITVSHCPCRPGTCATVCVRIDNMTHTAGNGVTIVPYGPGTDCRPGGANNVLPIGPTWNCLTLSTSTIFFGKDRGGGAIGDIGSATVSFDLAVWAACPDNSPPSPSYSCTTHRYTVGLGNGDMPVCHCDTPTGPAASLCGGPNFSPCPANCTQSTCTANPPCPQSIGTPTPPGDPNPIASTPIACPS